MEKKSRVCVTNLFSADKSGCYYYRLRFPAAMCECKCSDVVRTNYLDVYNTDPQFFKHVRCNILQRQITNLQRRYFLEYLVPVSRRNHSWLMYSIDDPIGSDAIPKYNKAWEHYQGSEEQENIRKMLNASDFVLVTTQELAMYYNEKFGVPKENILFVQNYLPKYLFDGWYDDDRIARTFEAYEKKPRIGIIGGSSHYNVRNVLDDSGKPVPDDFSVIADYVRKTVDKYQWVVFSTKIPAIADLIDSGKVEFNDGCDILSYPRTISWLGLQAVVAPLQDNIFNRCKSNLKIIEPWSLGIVPIVQDLPNYSRYTKNVFKDADSLDAQIARLLGNEDAFMTEIKNNRDAMEPWWLENHIRDWLDIFMIRPKNEIVSYDAIKEDEKKERDVAIEKSTKEHYDSIKNGGK